MRWRKHKHSIGTFRYIKRFLFLPERLGGEYRWLEMATIKQMYCKDSNVGGSWRDISWHNKKI